MRWLQRSAAASHRKPDVALVLVLTDLTPQRLGRALDTPCHLSSGSRSRSSRGHRPRWCVRSGRRARWPAPGAMHGQPVRVVCRRRALLAVPAAIWKWMSMRDPSEALRFGCYGSSSASASAASDVRAAPCAFNRARPSDASASCRTVMSRSCVVISVNSRWYPCRPNAASA